MDLYVAPLKDSMVLGMYFLRDHKAKLDLDAGTLCLGSETICIYHQIRLRHIRLSNFRPRDYTPFLHYSYHTFDYIPDHM